MSKKKPSAPSSFEDSLEQLEAIIRKLEGGQLPLDDSLEQYEQGIRHLGLCYKTLARVEKKVELLSGFDAQGKPITAPFDDGTNSIESNSPSPKSPATIKKRTAKKKGTARSRSSNSSARTKQAKGNFKSNVDEGDTLF